jgi:hypothetical protein
MANTFTKIASVSLSSAAATIDFNSIPGTYTDLQLFTSLRNSNSGNSFLEISISFNSNTSNYTAKQLYGDGTSPGSSSPTVRPIGFAGISGTTANTFSNSSLYIPNYASANNKSYSSDSVTEANQTQAYANLVAGLWSDSAAITSISIAATSGNLVTYSTATLYGIKNS